jgi:BlaI family transcriptional regulator, penicillinase repressor
MAEELSAISQAELEVLKALWEQGPAAVRQLQQRLDRWAYTTVQTLLTRLENKGYVASDKSGFAHVFRAVVSREELLRHRLIDLSRELSEGETTPLVMALVQGQRFSAEEIQQFRQLVDRLEAEQQAESRSAGRSSPAQRKPRRPPKGIDLS